MMLQELAAGFAISPAETNPEITAITEDSRRATTGALFVAVAGSTHDGHAFVPEALSRGAAAVVVEHGDAVRPGVAQVRVDSSRAALAELAARFHGRPADALSLIGFTGTFGKTSTSEVLRALLDAAGGRTGVLGSLGARYRAFRAPPGPLTTPAPVELHHGLRGLADAGATTVIMEVTSHALLFRRIDGLQFAGGLLAAIMPGEHTDFHRSYEDYVGAKRRLLRYLSRDAVFAYDADNHAARRIAADAAVRQRAGFSIDGHEADLQLYDILADARGATFSIAGRLAGSASGTRLHSALLGRGHLRNVALALTYAMASGVDPDAARSVLSELKPLRRRMERYNVAGRTVLDDTSAHPDSLRATFGVAGSLPHRNMIAVYALRGSRGVDINRQNAFALADLAALHGVAALIVTAAADCAADKDRATASEVDAARQALVTRGASFVWHDTLGAAIDEAVSRSTAGDLLVLAGAQAMDRGKELLGSTGPPAT
jgi:UDP-N-acetylmuramoyl-L-alanyl-D-glutamate--2,6-diaminopimelate ligase